MCDITDKEFEEIYLPFYNNVNDYLNNYVIPALVAFYLITAMKKSFQNFSWGQSPFNEQIIKDMEIELPFVNDKIDYDFMRKYIEVQEKIVINKIMGEKKKI